MRSSYSSRVRRLSSVSANSLLAKGALVAALLCCSKLQAATTRTWNGGGTDFLWSDTSNWSGAVANGDNLTFAGTTKVNTPGPDNTTITSVGNISFSSGAGAFTINGNAFTTTSGATITNSSTNLQTIQNGITLGGNSTWTATSGALDFGGTVNNGGFLLTLKGAHNLTLSSAVSGSGGLTVNTSAGVTALNAANTYTGNTTITAGTLQVGGSGDLGDSGGSGAYAGTIADNGTLEYSSSVNQTLSGVISGAGALTKDTNSSTLTLSNNNTYTGNITISAGTLQVSGTGSLGTGSGPYTYAGTITDNTSGTLEYSSSATQTLSGAINGGGAVTKDGSSSDLTLSGTNGFTGGLNLNVGTVTVNSNNPLGGVGNVLTFGGGTLEIATSLSTAHQIIVGANSTGTLQIDSGKVLTLSSSVLTASNTASTLIVNGQGGATPGNLTLGANQTFNGTFDLANAKLSLAGFNLTVGTLEITGNSVIDFGGSTSASILSATNVTLDAGATLTVDNWNDTKEYFYSANAPTALALSNISWGAPYAGDTTKWLSYADGPGPGHQITPVPEPATYGAIFTAAALGLFFWFRLKVNAPRLAPVRVAIQY